MDVNLATASPSLLNYLANTPVIPPPPGRISNFVNPPTRAALQRWTTGVLLVVTLLLFINRLYIKTRMMKTWNWDDTSLIIGVVLACAEFGFKEHGLESGLIGRHMYDVPWLRVMQPDVAPYYYSAVTLQCWTVLFVRASFFLLYLRLFGRIRFARIGAWIGLIFLIIAHGTLGIFCFAVANPHEVISWRKYIFPEIIALGAVGIASDVFIFVLPYFVLNALPLASGKKAGASVIFLTGICAIVCSVLNLHYRILVKDSEDELWDAIPANILSLTESLLGIMCACIPTIAFGFRQSGSIYQRIFSPSACITSHTPRRYTSRPVSDGDQQRLKSVANSTKSRPRSHPAWVRDQRNRTTNDGSVSSLNVIVKMSLDEIRSIESNAMLRNPGHTKYALYPPQQTRVGD